MKLATCRANYCDLQIENVQLDSVRRAGIGDISKHKVRITITVFF